MKPLSELAHFGIPLRTLQQWCEDGDITAEKRGREWYIDLEDMARRHGHESLADEIGNGRKD